MPRLLNKLPTLPIRMLGKQNTPSTVAKDLGIQIDQSLIYNGYITKRVSTCLHKLLQINKIKRVLDRKTILLLMTSFVFSKSHYCSTVWSNTSKHNILKLQLMQNFAASIVLGLKKFDHVSQGIKSLNWRPVNNRALPERWRNDVQSC